MLGFILVVLIAMFTILMATALHVTGHTVMFLAVIVVGALLAAYVRR